ncbi:MAG TPA: L,D-transpeptidase family protein [Xanthobacteraceae bacterium]|nr:L,D-transpeptidase family protein [Xanthobacteraceae bacterium]
MRAAPFALTVIAALIAAGTQATAASRSRHGSIERVESRAAGEPIMAIVSLRGQRITIYDAKGWILRAPVSSGQRGRETPAGVFAVIQKDAEHYSNLYDDAYMPHMQRLTWSGIAIHGGVVPGYPASHGCVRMPYDFAAHLFDETKVGMRVIVAPGDSAPAAITHPALFRANTEAEAVAAARSAEAEAATRKADQARLAAVTASREAARAMVPVRRAENLQRRAEAELAAAETALGSASSDAAKQKAEDAKAKAAAKLADLQAQLTAAKADLQPKLDAVAPAREAAAAAEVARTAAVEAARAAARDLQPISVFISRKSQHLYVRRAFQPVFDSPVTILDPDRPIGTHVFTATEQIDGGADMQWTVVTLESGSREAAAPRERKHGRRVGHGQDPEPSPPNLTSAKEALDRIVIPQDVLDRIAGMASPRSSLIISDEELSQETGKGTDFVVVLNDQPQGGIAMRRRSPPAEARYEPRYRRPSWRGPFGGGPFFRYFDGPF